MKFIEMGAKKLRQAVKDHSESIIAQCYFIKGFEPIYDPRKRLHRAYHELVIHLRVRNFTNAQMKSFKNAFVEKIMRAIIRVGDYVAYDDQHVLKQRLINLGASDFFQVGLGIYYGVQKKVFEAL